MRRIVFSAVAAAAISVPACFIGAQAQSTVQPASNKTPSAATDNVNVPDIVRKFAAKEKEFAEARNNYTYRQSLKFEECDPSGNPSGHGWQQISDIIFTPEGRRMEKVVYAPVPNLENIILTPED